MPWEEWAAIGALATACFTGGTVIISYLGHRQSQAVSGFRNPIKVGSPKSVGTFGPTWAVHRRMNEFPNRTLAITLYLFNRSGATQILVLDGPNCRLLKPAHAGAVEFPERKLEFEPFTGGNVQIKLICAEPWGGAPHGRILLAATTHSGQRIRKKVRVDFRLAPALSAFGTTL